MICAESASIFPFRLEPGTPVMFIYVYASTVDSRSSVNMTLIAGLFRDKRSEAARPFGTKALRAVHIPRKSNDHGFAAEAFDFSGRLLGRVRQAADLQRSDRTGEDARGIAFCNSDAGVPEIDSDINHSKISFLFRLVRRIESSALQIL